jgi:hypothetical protein
MLTQSFQKRCVWASIALFSIVALSGNGLHFLPGMGHSGCGHVELCSSNGRENSFSDAHHHSDSHAFSTDCRATSSLNSDDDCPICHFLAQAKNLVLAIHFEGNSEFVCRYITVYSSLSFEAFRAAYHSRAPPSWQVLA